MSCKGTDKDRQNSAANSRYRVVKIISIGCQLWIQKSVDVKGHLPLIGDFVYRWACLQICLMRGAARGGRTWRDERVRYHSLGGGRSRVKLAGASVVNQTEAAQVALNQRYNSKQFGKHQKTYSHTENCTNPCLSILN